MSTKAQKLTEDRFRRDVCAGLLEYAGDLLRYSASDSENVKKAQVLAGISADLSIDLVAVLIRHWKPEERPRPRRSIP